MKKKLYKFVRTGLKSENGDCVWEIGKWKKEEKIEICSRGFHASKTPLQALGYVKGEILTQVEVRGDSITEDDKECWSEMRIVHAWNWTKEDSVELAIFAAEQVIGIYEKERPNDDRPRKAIEAAKVYLTAVKSGDKDASAYAAANTAANASAYAAANTADAAAYAAAYAAANTADAAAYAAANAANAANAARQNLIASLDKWFIKKLKTLKPYEN